MAFYFELIFILFVLSIAISLAIRKKEDANKVQALLGGAVLAFFVMFRNPEFGMDMEAYLSNYQQLEDLSWKTIITKNAYTDFEIGYLILCKLFTYISASPHFFVFWMGLLCTIPIVYMVYKYSPSPVFSYIIYILSYAYYYISGILRQGVAMGICWLALDVMIQKKEHWLRNTLLLICLASTQHVAALLMLPLVLLSPINKLNYKYYICMGISIICVLLFGAQISSLLVTSFDRGYGYVVDFEGGIGRLVISGSIFGYFIVHKKAIYRYDKYASMWEKILSLIMLYQFFSYSFTGISRGMRILTYLNAIILARINKGVKKRERLIWNTAIIGAYLMLFITGFENYHVYSFGW